MRAAGIPIPTQEICKSGARIAMRGRGIAMRGPGERIPRARIPIPGARNAKKERTTFDLAPKL